mgnify:FL=1
MIPEKILQAIKEVAAYADSTDDWVRVKIEIMNRVPWQLRTNFSRRDQKTKEQWLNDFDKEVIEEWKKITGVELKIKEKESVM